VIVLLSKEIGTKFDQIFCEDILQIFYNDIHLQR